MRLKGQPVRWELRAQPRGDMGSVAGWVCWSSQCELWGPEREGQAFFLLETPLCALGHVIVAGWGLFPP